MPFWTDLLNRIARRQGENGDTFPVNIVDGDYAVGVTNDGKLKVDNSGSPLPVGAATEAKQVSILAQTDIKLSALRDAIAASGANAKTLKDLHDKLTSLETEIQAIKGTAGIKKIADTVDVQIVGGIPEYSWFASAEERPTPKEPDRPAIGIEVDTDTMEITGLLWNGEEWEDE